MANRTDPDADTVHGANPQFLVDRIIRVKIYNDAYWKEYCFGLTTESLIDEAAKLDYVAGTYGGRRRPARFLCLFLKLLQIQPEEEVVMEYIKQPELKYLRALGCAYLRITARYPTIFQTFEPLFADYRKLRYRDMYGKISIIHMDEFVDWLLREETVCDVTMPQMPKREILEQTGMLQPYQSVLEDDLEDLEDLERSLQELQSSKE
ncbi:Prp38, partial [Symbiodinium pilosum]